MKTKGSNAEKVLAERARWLQDVIEEWKKGKRKGVKLTPQEWIELSMAIGGFKPAPPPKPFLVEQRRKGVAQQMEFTFERPQAVKKRRRKIKENAS